MAASELIADVITGQTPPEFLTGSVQSRPGTSGGDARRYPGALSMNLRETSPSATTAALTDDVLDRLLYGYYDMARRTRDWSRCGPVDFRDFRIVKALHDGRTASRSSKRLPTRLRFNAL